MQRRPPLAATRLPQPAQRHRHQTALPAPVGGRWRCRLPQGGSHPSHRPSAFASHRRRSRSPLRLPFASHRRCFPRAGASTGMEHRTRERRRRQRAAMPGCGSAPTESHHRTSSRSAGASRATTIAAPRALGPTHVLAVVRWAMASGTAPPGILSGRQSRSSSARADAEWSASSSRCPGTVSWRSGAASIFRDHIQVLPDSGR